MPCYKTKGKSPSVTNFEIIAIFAIGIFCMPALQRSILKQKIPTVHKRSKGGVCSIVVLLTSVQNFPGGDRGGDTFKPPSPYEQLLPLPTPCFKMFLERSLNDPRHPTSSILHCYPPPHPPPLPPPLKILIIHRGVLFEMFAVEIFTENRTDHTVVFQPKL